MFGVTLVYILLALAFRSKTSPANSASPHCAACNCGMWWNDLNNLLIIDNWILALNG